VRIWTCNDPQRPAGAQNWKLKDEGNGYFALINQYSGGCLDDKLGAKTPGTHVQQWTCFDFVTQNWKFDPLGNGYYMVTNQNSGLVLDDFGRGTAPGTDVILFAPNLGGPTGSNANQSWRQYGSVKPQSLVN